MAAPALLEAAWLAPRLGGPALRVLDASYHLPNTPRNAAREHGAARVPTSRFFDLDSVCDARSPLPHMLPRPAAFAQGAPGVF